MACYSPLKGTRRPDGTVRFNVGLFSGLDVVTVSCGQCIGCRLERSRQWAVRIMHEASLHEYNSFLTLTYRDADLPADGSLDVKHHQGFMHRLRASVRYEEREKKKKTKVRYYHCGEYGEKKNRPHYHSCLFGVDFSGDRKGYGSSKTHNPLFTSKRLDELWQLGECKIGTLTTESAAYVARYVMAKKGGPAADHYLSHTDMHTGEIVSRKKEYASMSLKPGIGADWLKKFRSDVYPRDQVIIDGRIQRPPRYYDVKQEEHDPDQMEDLKAEREFNASFHTDNNTPARLAVREQCKKLQLRKLKRENNL